MTLPAPTREGQGRTLARPSESNLAGTRMLSPLVRWFSWRSVRQADGSLTVALGAHLSTWRKFLRRALLPVARIDGRSGRWSA